MKTKLLYLFIFMLSVLSLNAQTGTITNFSMGNNPIELGGTLNISFDYTSTVAGTIEIALYKSQNSGSEIDWNTSVNWHTISVDIAATATTVNETITLTGIADTSADIAPEVYAVMLQLKDGSTSLAQLNSYGIQANNTVTINAASTVLNTVTFLSTPSATVEAGESIEVSVNYTLLAEGILKFAVRKYDNEWDWIGDDNGGEIIAEYLNPAPATDSDGTDVTRTLLIPEATTASADLTNQLYRVYVSLHDPSWASFTDKQNLLIITAPTVAGLEDINADGIVMYPNPVSDNLFIKNSKLEAKSIKIFDIMGRTVKSISNTKDIKSIDVSSFSKGIYILTTDNKKQFKFIKK